jgi:sodium/bile acid cotransporter 7
MMHLAFHSSRQYQLVMLLILALFGVFNVNNMMCPPTVWALQTITNARSTFGRRHHRQQQHRLFDPCCLRAGGDNNDVLISATSVGDNNDNIITNTSNTVHDDLSFDPAIPLSQRISKVVQYANKNFFLIGMFTAVIFAKIIPSLGKNGGILRPELFIGNCGVALIFLLSGLSLQTKDLTQAISNVKLNGLVQLLIFGFWPFCIGLPLRYVLTRILPNLIPPALVDGILIMTTLPTTVNMCIMLTSTAGGNTASAICNAVISNLGGIVLTPLLLLKFFGASIHLPFGKMVLKLCQKVLLPVTIGQLLRNSDRVKNFYKNHSKTFKRLQEIILLGIVWNAFCNAFGDGFGIQLKHSLVLLILLPTLHVTALAAFFKLFSLPSLRFTKGETISAMFCSSQKTLAFGLPLVNTIFQGNPNLASYCAPIMFIHPLQMAIGSFLLPTIQKFMDGGDGDVAKEAN